MEVGLVMRREMLSEKKKTKRILKKKKEKKYMFILFQWGWVLDYKLFFRPIPFGGPARLSDLHPKGWA